MKEESMKRIHELSAELAEIAKEERIPLVLAYEEDEGTHVYATSSPLQVAIMIDRVIRDDDEINNAMAGLAFMRLFKKKQELNDKEKEVADGK